MTRVGVIIVTHNNADHIADCLGALPKALAPIPYTLTVVDTASDDETLSQVKQHAPTARCIPLGENVGFARAVNLAAREVTGHLLLLNPDTVPEPGSLATLVRALEAHPHVAAVGPALITPEGCVDPRSARGFPTLAREAADKVGLAPRLPARCPGGGYYLGHLPGSREVPVLSGAALLVRRAAWDAVEGLDEGFWLYAEDTDMCRRLWSAGWRCLYVPEARVRHLGGGSARPGEHLSLGIVALESMARYFAKHHGRGAARAYRGLMLVIALAKVPYWAARGRADHLRVQAAIARWAVTGQG